jgi:Flp pilus assembly protein TadD
VVEDNTEALKINPEFLQAFNDRAIAYDLLGREDLAEADRRSYNLLKRKLIFEGKI